MQFRFPVNVNGHPLYNKTGGKRKENQQKTIISIFSLRLMDIYFHPKTEKMRNSKANNCFKKKEKKKKRNQNRYIRLYVHRVSIHAYMAGFTDKV